MRRVWFVLAFVAALALIGLVLHHRFGEMGMAQGPLMHARSEFTFTVQAPMAEAFPLFGPEGERAWAGPEWDPQFVYPIPGEGCRGRGVPGASRTSFGYLGEYGLRRAGRTCGVCVRDRRESWRRGSMCS